MTVRKTAGRLAAAGVLGAVLFAASPAGSAFAHFCYNANKPMGAGNHSTTYITVDEEFEAIDFQSVSNHPGRGNGPGRPTGGFTTVVVLNEEGQEIFGLPETFAHNYLEQAASVGSPTNGIQEWELPE